MSVYDKYEIVVGLEVHAQLKTETKIFAPDSAAFGAAPNTHLSYITAGHPGTLPKINRKAVAYAVKMGLATNCTISRLNYFDRKNYFYPDLPKGYQITQDAAPICTEGYVCIRLNGQEKKVRLNRIHLEEDAGKSVHDQDEHYSFIDLNRAGVPLIEIVSEPDIRSGEEAVEYLTELRKILRYLDICDGNMEEGSMRCDANVSVRLKGHTGLGQRTETKNMNSIRNVRRAINYEAKRQIDLLEAGGAVVPQTRSFNAANGTNFPLRSKEAAHDYRYFPEPDLPPIVLSEQDIARIKADMPALPRELFLKFTQTYGLSEYDAGVLTADKATADYFSAILAHTKNYKAAANWLTVIIKAHLNKTGIKIADFEVAPQKIADIIALIETGKLSNSAAAQKLFPMLLEQPQAIPEKLAVQHQLIMQSDHDLIDRLLDDILAQHPDKVKRYQKGKKGLAGFFMGQLMRAAKGRLDPKSANKRLAEKLKIK